MNCASPHCPADGEVEGAFSSWCAEHAAILGEVRKSLRAKTGPKPVANGRAEIVKTAASKLAAAAQQGVTLDEAAALASVGATSAAMGDALALAQSRGWIVVEDGRLLPGEVEPHLGRRSPARPERGKTANPRVSRHERALRLARAVHTADGGWLSGLDAADAAGCARDGLTPVTRIAREAGWIVAQRGRPGYHAGPTPPPAE